MTNIPYRTKQTEEVMQDLSELLRKVAAANYDLASKNNEKDTAGLFGGTAGILLFLFYYERYFVSSVEKHKAGEFLDKFLENLSAGYFSYSNGLAGIGWLIEHLIQKKFIGKEYRYLLTDLDDELNDIMFEELNRGHYDYIHGALGCLFYYLNRKSNLKQNRQRILKFIDLLEENADYQDDAQIYWAKFDEESGKDLSDYDLGLSHGIPSVAAILIKARKAGYAGETLNGLIDKSVCTILNSKNTDKNVNGIYPYSKSMHNSPSRLAWCYGDPGIAVALLNAGKVKKRKDWTNEGAAILKKSTERLDPKENIVLDAGFCHGAAGIAHIYNRFSKNKGLSVLRYSADYWFAQILQFNKYENGTPGLLFQSPYRSEDIIHYSFLEGITGVGMTLISFLSADSHSFDWDESLLFL